MIVKGTNFKERQNRLTRAFGRAMEDLQVEQIGDNWRRADAIERRMRMLRLAWIRIDDHLYPKGH